MGITAIAMIAAVTASAQASEPKLTVFVEDNASVPILVIAQAKSIASRMFAQVGIQLEWRTGKPSATATGVVAIQLIRDVPANRLPDALAYAAPFEGIHIQVFYDRIERRRSLAPMLLAHVMVHEITHIIEGTDVHRYTGVMKKAWSAEDYNEMRIRPLPFDPSDVFSIRYNWAKRTGAPSR
jgi:hypothetical protein